MADALQRVAGFEPVPLPISFVTSLPEVPLAFDQWKTGVTFTLRGRQIVHGNIIGCETNFDLEDGEAIHTEEFSPFEVYATYDGCREDLIDDSATVEANRRQVDIGSAWFMAREFWTGATISGNPCLQDSASLIGASASSAAGAIGALLANYHDRARSGGAVLHIPEVALPLLLEKGIVKAAGTRYVGPMDSTVVVGPGYPWGAGTSGTASAYGPLVTGTRQGQTAGQVWAYVTGRVEWGLGPIDQPLSAAGRQLPLEANGWFIRGTRRAIYRFDSTAAFAALLTLE